MARILIAISADIYVRNYLRTDALHLLSRDNEVTVIADESLALAAEVQEHPDFGGFFGLDPAIKSKHSLLFSLLMWRRRKKSPTFLYRWMRNSQWDLLDRDHGPLRWLLSFVRWIPGALVSPSGLRVPALGNPLVFGIAKAALVRQLSINPELSALVRAQDYDIIVFPSAAFDSVSVDLTRLGQELAIPTLCLIDNWDNLTSKTSFWTKPDHLGVWGEQAREQAARIHGFLPDRVHPIGTPRFDQYFSSRKTPNSSPLYPFPYLLFVGSAMPFDEIATLHHVERTLARLESVPPGLKIVYRPHPWQQKRKTDSEFRPAEFLRTVLDAQIAEAYASGMRREVTDPSFQPDLDYYPRLFQGATAVIGPLTTMLFEGALALKPVMGLAYDDGHHANTSRRYFTHFDGVEAIPSFVICETQEEMPTALSALFAGDPIEAETSDSHTAYFLHQDGLGYPTRLKNLVQYVSGTGDK